MGNLLENAVEACGRMTDGERFIRINASIRKRFLVILVDNSFDGDCRKTERGFLSEKRAELGQSSEGIGVCSVRALAEKYGGYAQLEADGRVFRASVSLEWDG